MKYMYGNWKMNQDSSSIRNFFSELKLDNLKCELGIAPQALHISLVKDLAPPQLEVGGQNISHVEFGAYTGENSVASLKDLGATFCLVGHSERRTIFNEDHLILNEKAKLALKSGLKVIFCIGELLEERKLGKTFEVLKEQLLKGLTGIENNQNLLIAYEPVWAIGTGEVATPEQAEEAHKFVRETISHLGPNTPILYGGSVKPSNAEGLLSKPNIDGALVGGASLKGTDFTELCNITSALC